jgi:hypothetical protein
MLSTKKGIVLALFLAVVRSGSAGAEPSYLIYPDAPTVFHYDTSRYELVAPGDPKFDSGYAIGNQMLWDRVAGRLPVEVYRAPQLVGFEPSTSGVSEFVVYRIEFDVVIDGFGDSPRTIGNLCLRFWPQPAHANVTLNVGGQVTNRLTVPLPSLEVSTPLGSEFYSDTQTHTLSWVGATSMRIIAFSDKNANGSFDGTVAFAIVTRDATVPVSTSTWGNIKALYRR